MKPIRITIKRIGVGNCLDYEISSISGAVTVSLNKEIYRVGDRITESLISSLCEGSDYSVTVKA
jgi:hypothetical protein